MMTPWESFFRPLQDVQRMIESGRFYSIQMKSHPLKIEIDTWTEYMSSYSKTFQPPEATEHFIKRHMKSMSSSYITDLIPNWSQHYSVLEDYHHMRLLHRSVETVMHLNSFHTHVCTAMDVFQFKYCPSEVQFDIVNAAFQRTLRCTKHAFQDTWNSRKESVFRPFKFDKMIQGLYLPVCPLYLTTLRLILTTYELKVKFFPEVYATWPHPSTRSYLLDLVPDMQEHTLELLRS